jgi:hypothetical protein
MAPKFREGARWSGALAAVALAVGLLAAGCASSGEAGSGDSGDPGSSILVVVVNESGQRYELSYTFGRNTPRRVGSIRSGEELEVRVQVRPGDLRFILDDSGIRTFTSNAAPNVRPGETYRLLISSTRDPQLRLMTEGR